MFQCFETFRNMGKRGDFVKLLKIFLYHSLYVSMFQFVAKHMETHGVTCFNIVLKRFETGET